MDRLAETIDRYQDEVREGLTQARAELESIREREAELVALIEKAEGWLERGEERERMTLHEAIILVLEDRGSEWMTTQEIAREVNLKDLYRKRDGSPVESNQIHARTKNYPHLFEKDRQRIRLRDPETPPPSPGPAGRSKYDALREWLIASDDATPMLKFDQIAGMVGGLPASAWNHQAWWANDTTGVHVQARSWLSAGYRVARIDQTEGWVLFERSTPDPDDGTAGVREPRTSQPSGPAGVIELDTPTTNEIQDLDDPR